MEYILSIGLALFVTICLIIALKSNMDSTRSDEKKS